jgi:hypothetical protein
MTKSRLQSYKKALFAFLTACGQLRYTKASCFAFHKLYGGRLRVSRYVALSICMYSLKAYNQLGILKTAPTICIDLIHKS